MPVNPEQYEALFNLYHLKYGNWQAFLHDVEIGVRPKVSQAKWQMSKQAYHKWSRRAKEVMSGLPTQAN